MKYPIIYEKYETPAFKHCSKAIALQIDIRSKDAFLLSNQEVKEAYLKDMLRRIHVATANMFIMFQSTVFEDQDTYFTCFKDNVDKNSVIHFINGLCKELMDNVAEEVEIYYAFIPAMLMLHGKDPNMFSATKVGEPITQSEKAKQALKLMTLQGARVTGKYLLTLEEFEEQFKPKQFDYYI